MAAALEPEPRFTRTLHSEPGAGLAHVGLESLGSAGQVAWNGDRTLALAMEGELFDAAAVERATSNGHEPPAESHAELVLRVYERGGEAGLARLNGAFAVAAWDRNQRQLTLFNDRLGLHPLYYAQVNGGLLFGSGVRALLADPALNRAVDLVALNQFLVHDHVLDDRTFLESVRLLPQASVLTFRDGKLTIRPYWQLRYPERYKPQAEEAYVEGLEHHLRQAVRRQRPDSRPVGMLLSGGVDSRLILGLLCEEGAPLQTFTFGVPGCDDAVVAAEVARACGTTHRFHELKPDWLAGMADAAVRATDGLGNIVNLHAMANVEAQSRHASVLFKGFLGDALLGWALRRQMWGDYADADRYEVHRAAHRFHGVLNYEPPEEARLFTSAFAARVGDGLYRAYRDGMDRSGSHQVGNQRLYFDLTQRVPRMTLNGVEVARTHAVVRLPFADNDLLDFVLTVPPGFLFERHLSKAVLVARFPKLAGIPVTGTGRPLQSNARDLVVQAKSLLSWHLKQRGLGRLAPAERRPYKDYDGWFRTVLHPWVERILLDRRTLDRGYFRPDYVRGLVESHMNGARHAVRLGGLLTIELWHRQFLD
ncbi:MAG: asparagine synthetase B [Vicinamibacterales bacterium]